MNAAKRAVARVGWCVPALALVFLCATSTVRAQDFDETQLYPWSIKVGAFFPTQGTFRNQTGNPFWAIGADYNPHFTHNILDGEVFFSADLFIRWLPGDSAFVLPLTANIVWNITPPDTKYRVYGGIGVGAYFVNPVTMGGTTRPGLRFSLGADLTERAFLQMNYDWVSGFTDNLGNGVRVDGLSTLVGFRF